MKKRHRGHPSLKRNIKLFAGDDTETLLACGRSAVPPHPAISAAMKSHEPAAARKPDALKRKTTQAEKEVEAARAHVHVVKQALKQARKGLKKAKAQARQVHKALKAAKKGLAKSAPAKVRSGKSKKAKAASKKDKPAG